MDNLTTEYLNAKKYVIQRIKSNIYPPSHIFNSPSFKDDDYIIHIMVNIKFILKETDLINDYIDNKLKAYDQGDFSVEKYFQGLNELTFLYYLIIGVMGNSAVNLNYIYYEGFSPYKKSKKLEYQLVLDNLAMVNVEIKSITCDPLYKESDFKLDESAIYIKKYFNDADLSFKDGSNEESYKVLSESTHSRQLRKNIKKIVEKFDGDSIDDVKMINIGVVVIQFATSLEEFFSYMLNEEKGIIKDIDFKNLDCLVFFSLTARPRFDMQDIYNNGHIFTIMLNDKQYIKHYLKVLRMDNIVAQKTINGFDIAEPVKPYAAKEFGKYKIVIDENNKCFFVSYDTKERDIKSYSQYLNGEIEYPNFCGNN